MSFGSLKASWGQRVFGLVVFLAVPVLVVVWISSAVEQDATWTVIDHTGREFEGCVLESTVQLFSSEHRVRVIKSDGSRAMFYGNISLHEE